MKSEGLLERSIKIVEGMENIPEMMVISSLVFLVIRRLTMSLKQREYLFIQIVIKLESSLS